ncbi:MAG: hypothetical protein AB8B74_01525 [Crocinitomicaceae bacterium]
MLSKKENFLDQLQFELGDRWPQLDYNSISTVDELADFIEGRQATNPWPFLKFLTFYTKANQLIEKKKQVDISSNFDLNKLTKSEKVEFIQLVKEFGQPLLFRRSKKLSIFVFTFPVLTILTPLLISTYLVAALNYSGWLYLSSLAGLLLSIGLFRLTESLKNKFSPSSILEYSKSLYVINNQKWTQEPSREMLIYFICQSAKAIYQTDFKSESIIPK